MCSPYWNLGWRPILKSSLDYIKHERDAQLQAPFTQLSRTMPFSQTVAVATSTVVAGVKDDDPSAGVPVVSFAVARVLAAGLKLLGCPRTGLDGVRSGLVTAWLDTQAAAKPLKTDLTIETIESLLEQLKRFLAGLASFKELHDRKWTQTVLARAFRKLVPPPYLKEWSATEEQVLLAIDNLELVLAIATNLRTAENK